MSKRNKKCFNEIDIVALKPTDPKIAFYCRTKITFCPKCKTRVPVNGRKGRNIKVTCPNCNDRSVVKL